MTNGQSMLALAVASLLLDGFAESESEAEAHARMTELGLAATAPYQLVVLAVRLTNKAVSLPDAAQAMDTMLGRRYSSISIASGGRVLSLMLSKDGFACLDTALNELSQTLHRQLDTKCLVGVSRRFSAFTRAHGACAEAVEAQRSLTVPGIVHASGAAGTGHDGVRKRDGVSFLCDRAMKIIDNEYMDEELTLSSVSERLHVSASYLSANMKKYAGGSFVSLLTKRRMEAALAMLGTEGMKIGELARRCGYGDQHYFSVCFKKYYGASPAKLKHEKVCKK